MPASSSKPTTATPAASSTCGSFAHAAPVVCRPLTWISLSCSGGAWRGQGQPRCRGGVSMYHDRSALTNEGAPAPLECPFTCRLGHGGRSRAARALLRRDRPFLAISFRYGLTFAVAVALEERCSVAAAPPWVRIRRLNAIVWELASSRRHSYSASTTQPVGGVRWPAATSRRRVAR